MALKPEDRYASAEALADDVERWLADEPVTAWREPFSVRARRWVRRHRTAVTGAAAAGWSGSSASRPWRSCSPERSPPWRRRTSNHTANAAPSAETKDKKKTQAALALSEESRGELRPC